MRQHVIISIPCLLLGGSELATLSLVAALVQGEYEVIVCCYYEHDVAMVRRFTRWAGIRDPA